MNELYRLLTPIEARLDQLLLDPNNPRFAELGESESSDVPESRVAEPKVQEAAFKKMKSPKFDVNELRDTIKTVGFLPMDRIVVRKVKNDKKTKDKESKDKEGSREKRHASLIAFCVCSISDFSI